LLLISVDFPGDRFVMRTALAAVRNTTTDDHEFVHRRFVENALHPGASDRRAIFSFKLVCRNLAV
jgi:hypothetical protein